MKTLLMIVFAAAVIGVISAIAIIIDLFSSKKNQLF